MKNRMAQSPMGFTLIELLLAMFILVLLVLLSSRLFSTASQTFNTGIRKAEINLVGRSVLDFLDRDISRAVFYTNSAGRLGTPESSGHDLRYWVLSDYAVPDGSTGMRTSLVDRVTISLSGDRLIRSSSGTNRDLISNMEDITFELDDPDWPTYVDVALHFKASEDRHVGRTNLINVFSKRIYFPNYTRNLYDDDY